MRVYEAGTDIDEAGFIVEEVKALHNEGLRLSDIALLYRSNAQSRVLEHALFNAGISYRVYGGLRFFERQEIKHALAYLRLLASDEDDGALLRIINFPARGIGNRSLEQLQDLARSRGVSLWTRVAAEEAGSEGKKAREEAGSAAGQIGRRGIRGADCRHARGVRRPAAARNHRTRDRTQRTQSSITRTSARAPTGSKTSAN